MVGDSLRLTVANKNYVGENSHAHCADNRSAELRRAQASHSIGYHIALAVAMAPAPLAVEAPHQHGFVMTFLSRWGEAIDKPKTRGRR
jgi:hypothetical protein